MEPSIASTQNSLSQERESERCGQPCRLVASQKVFITLTEVVHVVVDTLQCDGCNQFVQQTVSTINNEKANTCL